jgi:hypothetical protein
MMGMTGPTGGQSATASRWLSARRAALARDRWAGEWTGGVVIDLHSLPVIVAVVAGLIALSAVAGYWLATVLHAHEDAGSEPAGSEPAAGGEPATGSRAEVEAAGERYGSAVEHFSQALKACEGTRRRLGRLAGAARETATAFRECDAVGFVASGRQVDAGARAPWELRRDGPRLAVSAWQPFDRSVEAMLATLDDPDADLRAYATACDRLADAAEAVAGALHDSEINRRAGVMHVVWQTQPEGRAADRWARGADL